MYNYSHSILFNLLITIYVHLTATALVGTAAAIHTQREKGTSAALSMRMTFKWIEDAEGVGIGEEDVGKEDFEGMDVEIEDIDYDEVEDGLVDSDSLENEWE